MKILIVSDSHGRIANFIKVMDKVQPIDMLIHLGDFEGHEDEIEMFANCETHFVKGNNDYFTDLDREKIITIGSYQALLCHGHHYGVTFGTERIKSIARGMGASIVMFGHTHRPLIDLQDDVIAINPGSITQPRQEGRIPSYIVMEIDRYGLAHYTLNYLT